MFTQECKLRKIGKGDTAGQTQNSPEIIYLDALFWGLHKVKRWHSLHPCDSTTKKTQHRKRVLPHLLVVLLLWDLYRMRANLTVTLSTRWSNGDITNCCLKCKLRLLEEVIDLHLQFNELSMIWVCSLLPKAKQNGRVIFASHHQTKAA